MIAMGSGEEISNFDVTIVGAGPAGAVLSYLLARSGVKTLLIERDSDFEREFRGPAYQPVTLEYFNEMGVLDTLLNLPHFSLSEFTVKEEGQNLLNFQLKNQENESAYAMALPQGPLLKTLVELAGEFPNFTFLGNGDAEELIHSSSGAVEGLKVRLGDKIFPIQSRMTIAADGRYSKLRDLAGIKKTDSQESFDVIWFDLPAVPGMPYELGLDISKGGILVAIPEKEGHLRIGWVLEKGTYQKLQRGGIEDFKRQIVQTKPLLKDSIDHLTSWKQLFYLDVQIAITENPLKDGLLLIGDAAHTASPVGAQGNKLAIQDAVALHPLLVDALKSDETPLQTHHFISFVQKRLAETKKIFRRQHLISQAIFSFQHPFIRKIRKLILPRIAPLFMKRMVKAIGWGFDKIHVDTSKFTQDRPEKLLHRYWHLKVQKVVQETKDTHSIFFSVPEAIQHLFQFEAGQFITLRLLDRGEMHRRCYSLSNSPSEKGSLRITVKRIQGGLISNDLIDLVQKGDSLLVMPPAGQFMADQNTTNHVLIAGGSGIGPLMSILYSLMESQKNSQVTLLFSNHSEEDIIFHDELKKLRQTYGDRLTLHFHLSKEKGRLNESSLSGFLMRFLESSTFYLCGPQGLMEASENVLLEEGIPLDRIRRERYHSIKEAFEEEVDGQQTLQVGSGDIAKSDHPRKLQVTLGGRLLSLRLGANETILDALIRLDEDPPYSCKEGICSTCIAKLISGKVEMKKHSALSAHDIEQRQILTCQARCLTKNTVVEY